MLWKLVLCSVLYFPLASNNMDICESRSDKLVEITNGFIKWKDGSDATLEELYKLIQMNIFYRRPKECKLGEQHLYILGNNAFYPLKIPLDPPPKRGGGSVFPRSCTDVFRGQTNPKSGIHLIHMPETHLKPFYVYCMVDPNNGTAWTVIQRRVNGKVDFEKSYEMYQHGFGGLSENFFLGLEKIYVLTTMAGRQELWVMLRSYNGKEVHAKYDHFAIGDEGMYYGLTVLGAYNGTAGDSLTYHLGQKFSTFDSDYRDCVKMFRGGWWYRSCYESNLNGIYGSNTSQGVNWKSYQGMTTSMKYVQIAIRPAQ